MSKLNKTLFFIWVTLLATLVFVLSIWGIEHTEQDRVFTDGQVQNSEGLPNLQPVVADPEEVIVKETMELAMIGDILLHRRIALYKDFTYSFEPIAPILQSYDYLIANQESLPVGNKYAITGYPQFSSPDYIIPALQNVGVDMINIANNHIVDKGEGGVRTLFENIDRFTIPYVGAYKSKEDANVPRIIEHGTIKIGVVSYTYGTNGLYLPKGSPFVINYINEENMKKDIAALKGLVDVVTVLIHWGPEYVTKENDTQRYLAKVLNDAGADIVFGTHPHILQPYDKLVNEEGQETHVFYSIGNFFATILTMPDTMVGGIASMQITKEGDDVTIGTPKFVATAVLADANGIFRVHPLKDTEQIAVRDLNWVQQILDETIIVN